MKEPDHPWITVSFDEDEFVVYYDNLEKENWTKTFSWKDITKICYKSYDYGAPDFLHIFFASRNDPCIIPIEEKDGEAFWEEVKRRKLFNPRYAIKADTRFEYNCWPKE